MARFYRQLNGVIGSQLNTTFTTAGQTNVVPWLNIVSAPNSQFIYDVDTFQIISNGIL